MNVAEKREKFHKAFGKSLKEHRLNVGMTQDQLARAVFTSRASIANIEKGRQSPTLQTCIRMSYALGVSLDDLIPVPSSEWL